MRGEVVGSYCLDKKLGEGGMGVVYRAKHTVLGKLAAVKMMRPQLCADAESVTRFFNEAVLTANIRHPGIVEIFDYGVHEKTGSAFITMELLEGESLEARLERERRLPVVDALRIAQQVASALAAAHSGGVIHRDLKPDNVFLTPDPDLPGGERIQLLDFGIAKLLDPEKQATSLTQTGTMIGTPLYMSPEQCRGRSDIDGRTDIYALGCMLYRMLSGWAPFTGGSPLEVAASHLRDTAEPLGKVLPGLPPPVSELVGELLAKRREDRPADAANLHRRFGRLLATIDTVKGIYDAPVDQPRTPSESFEVDRSELEKAATVATDQAALSAPRRNRWLAIAAVVLSLGAAAAMIASRAATGGDQPLAAPIELPRSCAGVAPDACRSAAWAFAMGDGVALDREAATEMLRDACAGGSSQACLDVLEVDRRYLLPRVDPHFGDPTAGYVAHLVVDFADPGLNGDVGVVWERLRGRFPGELSLVLMPAGRDIVESVRAARAACAAHGQKALMQFLMFQNLAGGYSWTRERLANHSWKDVNTERLLADYDGTCARSVERLMARSRDIEAPPGTLFIEGYRVPQPHNYELAAYFLDRFMARMVDRASRNAEAQRAIQATVRYPLEATGEPRPVTVTSVCDPAQQRCEIIRSVAGAQAQLFGSRLEHLTVARDPDNSAPARALCAADRMSISEPVLELLARVSKGEVELDDGALRPVVEKAGASFETFASTRDRACVDQLREHRARITRAGAPIDVSVYVNGRPARVIGTPSHALIREELELAELLGYGERIAAADYYRRLVSGTIPGDLGPRRDR